MTREERYREFVRWYEAACAEGERQIQAMIDMESDPPVPEITARQFARWFLLQPYERRLAFLHDYRLPGVDEKRLMNVLMNFGYDVPGDRAQRIVDAYVNKEL